MLTILKAFKVMIDNGTGSEVLLTLFVVTHILGDPGAVSGGQEKV